MTRMLTRSMTKVTSEYDIRYLGVWHMLPRSMAYVSSEYDICYLGVWRMLPRSLTYVTTEYDILYVISEYDICYLGVWHMLLVPLRRPGPVPLWDCQCGQQTCPEWSTCRYLQFLNIKRWKYLQNKTIIIAHLILLRKNGGSRKNNENILKK